MQSRQCFLSSQPQQAISQSGLPISSSMVRVSATVCLCYIMIDCVSSMAYESLVLRCESKGAGRMSKSQSGQQESKRNTKETADEAVLRQELTTDHAGIVGEGTHA